MRDDRTRSYSVVLLSSLKGLESPYDTNFPSVKTLGYCQGRKRARFQSILRNRSLKNFAQLRG
jgi:hypothetical protein